MKSGEPFLDSKGGEALRTDIQRESTILLASGKDADTGRPGIILGLRWTDGTTEGVTLIRAKDIQFSTS